ncbi:hypothetical protein PRZ48_007435 [Zasmidium cellare]|uniref:NmrA-like domain-containing protein n=1 Tax=Zasmidium cellare TaxID=395010 RepID=A0ABR0EK21_ZASCE|nr:hypothetical protein PRZ48_007435 [Zasmidium cellare]
MPSTTTLVVTGASGKQGSALISSILSRPSTENQIHIRAIVRNSRNDRCKALLQKTRSSTNTSLTFFEADFSDRGSLEPIFKGASALYLNTSPTFKDAQEEVKHAKNILAAADASVTIQHIMYASVVAVDDPNIWSRLGGTAPWAPEDTGPDTSIPTPDYRPGSCYVCDPMDETCRLGLQGYFSAKYTIEPLVQEWGNASPSRSWAILRPSWFMSDFLGSEAEYHWPELSSQKTLKTARSPTDEMMLVAPSDIGLIASKIFLDAQPAQWNGQIINIGSQALTMDDIAAALGHNFRVEYIPRDEAVQEVKGGNMLREVQAWCIPRQACFDLTSLEEMFGVELMSFDKFVQQARD